MFTSTPSTEPPIVKYYTWELFPSAKAKGYLTLTLYVKHLIAVEAICDLSEFIASILLSTTITGDYKWCFGVGYNITEIRLAVSMIVKLWNYAMTILDDLLDFSETWTGADARYFDQIYLSSGKTIKFEDTAIYDK